MKEIQLSCARTCKNTGKYVALVDDEDYEYLNQFSWCVLKGYNTFYAGKRIILENGKSTTKRMHHFIIDCEKIDHIDHDGLNCQRNNLRPCTKQQNCMNTRPNTNTSSIYKGVHYLKSRKNWQASIGFNLKKIWLGRFKTEIEAALAYNQRAVELFGEFACLNTIPKT